jgi:hypothetical protein
MVDDRENDNQFLSSVGTPATPTKGNNTTLNSQFYENIIPHNNWAKLMIAGGASLALDGGRRPE